MDTTTATPASPHPHINPDDVVMSLAEFYASVDISAATGRRLIKSGRGPVITELSERRRGVTTKHRREWLAARSGSAA
jgi:hypothetical protein